MRRIPTLIETSIFAVLSILGLYVTYEGAIEQESAYLLVGAVCFVLGFVGLIMAVRNLLWHRQMLRDSSARRGD